MDVDEFVGQAGARVPLDRYHHGSFRIFNQKWKRSNIFAEIYLTTSTQEGTTAPSGDRAAGTYSPASERNSSGAPRESNRGPLHSKSTALPSRAREACSRVKSLYEGVKSSPWAAALRATAKSKSQNLIQSGCHCFPCVPSALWRQY
eukprot:7386237-Prymnesium_polylepis.2